MLSSCHLGGEGVEWLGETAEPETTVTSGMEVVPGEVLRHIRKDSNMLLFAVEQASRGGERGPA